jgi:putative PEP-CTERM system TPR-repeat lipoprotein
MYANLRSIIGAASMVILVACSGEKSAEELVLEAENYSANGEYRAAIIELKNVLQSDRNHAEARWLLGQTYFSMGAYADAIKELEKAAELELTEDDLSPLRAKTYLELNNLQALQSVSIKGLSDDARATVLAAQGLGKLRIGGVKAASRMIGPALELSPESVYVLLAKARLVWQESGSDVGPVRQHLDNVFSIAPNDAAAWSLLGDVEMQAFQLEEAEIAYTQAIDNSEISLVQRYKRALIRLQLRKFELVRTDLKDLKALAKKSPGTLYIDGLLDFHDKDYKGAIASLEVVQQYENQYPLALFYLATAHNIEDNRAQAEDYAYRFLDVAPGNSAGIKLLTSIKLKAEYFEEAAQLIGQILEKNPDDIDANNLLAAALFKLGRGREGIEILAKVAKLQPESSEAQIRLGTGLLSYGELERGLQHISTAIALDPALEGSQLALASELMGQSDYRRALEVLERFEAENPGNLVPMNLRGKIYIGSGELELAKAVFGQVLEISPGDSTANSNLAYLATQAKNYDSARVYYENILEQEEDALPVLLKLAALAEISGDAQGMEAYLKEASSAHPDAVEPKVMLARHYLTEGAPAAVISLLNDLEKDQKMHPDILMVMGLSQMQRGRFLDARATFDDLIADGANAARARYNRGMANIGLENIDEATEDLGKALELYPEYLNARIELTRIQLRQKDREAAMKSLALLKEISPDNPEVLQLTAARARLDGDASGALEFSELAFQKAPSTRNMLIVSVQKWTMGDKAGSQKVQEDWLVANPEDVRARVELANLYTSTGDTKTAIKHYSKVLELDSDNTTALNNLAWQLRDTNLEKGLLYAQRAVTLNPESGETRDTLAVLQFNASDYSKAKRSIDRALEYSPDSPTIRYHSALINAALGDTFGAIKELSAILAGGRKFSEREEAQALLNSLQ